MKKAIITMICILMLVFFVILVLTPISAAVEEVEIKELKGTAQIVEMKDNAEKKLEDYKEEYGSDSYGFAAYILNVLRIYSIPFCFIGIALGAIYQYVIGIRKLDEKDKGFMMIIGFITILVISQVLPLIFAIVVKGWRG